MKVVLLADGAGTRTCEKFQYRYLEDDSTVLKNTTGMIGRGKEIGILYAH